MIENFVPAYNSDGVQENTTHAYWFIYRKWSLLVKSANGIYKTPTITSNPNTPMETEHPLLLGTYNGHNCYVAQAKHDAALPEMHEFRPLRELFGIIDDELFFIAGYAFDILHWLTNHQFCGSCGTKTIIRKQERAMFCPSCESVSYPRISPAIIVAVIKDDKILLARSPHFIPEMYSVLAGYLDPGESLEECVKREVREETNIDITNVRYFNSQPWPFSHSLMIGFIADYKSGEIAVDNNEIIEARWFTKTELPKIPGKLSIARALIDWFIENH